MRTLAVVTVLVVASLLTLWWWSGENLEAAPPTPASGPPAAAAPAPATPAPTPPPTAGAPERDEVPPAAAPTAAPEPPKPAPETPFDPNPVPVAPWTANFLVIDEADQPVADATIQIWAMKKIRLDPRMAERTGTRHGYSGRDGEPRAELRTGPDGRAATTLDLEQYVAAAHKGDVATAGDQSLWHTRTTEVQLLLQQSIPLHGVVRHSDGTAAAAATVTATVSGGRAPGGLAQPPVPVVTGDDGRFTLPVRRDIMYSLRAEWEGQRTFAERIFVQSPEPPAVTLTFPGAISLRGVVVDPAGAAVAGATVRAWREYRLGDPGQDADDYETAHATCDRDGRFVLPVRRHARYQLLASAEGHATSELLWAETTTVRPHAEVRVPLPAFAAIAGQVVHTGGAPFAGALVSAVPESGETGGYVAVPTQRDQFPPVAAVTTGEDGRFELRVHPGTQWTLRVFPVAGNRRLRVLERHVAPGRTDVRVTIGEGERQGCIVRGTVVRAADGQPVTDFTVRLVSFAEGGRVQGTYEARPKVEGNRFELEPLPLGEPIGLVVEAKGERPGVFRGPLGSVQLGPLEPVPAGLVVEARLPEWGEVPVRVQRPGGSALGKVTVGVVGSVPTNSFASPQAVDADGRVTLQHCQPGTARLSVYGATGRLHEQAVTVAPGLNPEIVVSLPAAEGTGR